MMSDVKALVLIDGVVGCYFGGSTGNCFRGAGEQALILGI